MPHEQAIDRDELIAAVRDALEQAKVEDTALQGVVASIEKRLDMMLAREPTTKIMIGDNNDARSGGNSV